MTKKQTRAAPLAKLFTPKEKKEKKEQPDSAAASKKPDLKKYIPAPISKLLKIKPAGEEKEAGFAQAPIALELPPFETNEEILTRYWLTPPHTHVTICKDDKNKLHYYLTEPKINEKEFVILEEAFEYLRSTLIFDTVKRRRELKLDEKTLHDALIIFDKDLSEERINTLIYYLNRNFTGYDKLDPLMHDDRIEDITCNGSDIPIFLYHREFGNIETNCVFGKDELNKFVLKLAQKADKQLSLTSPLIDATLPEGSRAQITYSDIISSKGSSFTIRKFKADPMTPAELVRGHTYSAELLAHIWLAVENRKSVLVAGGTASGKTSTMNAVSFFIPPTAKIVSIEDTCEIQLPHTNWLSMKTRTSSVNESGNVTMFTLLKAALRQRPEYIIVGEVRGKEAQTLFQAMNTGHTTYSTLHAGNVKEAVNRLTHDPINVPVAMFSALDLIIVQSLLYFEGKGFRRSTSLNETFVEGDAVKWRPLFEWNHVTDSFDKVFENSAVFNDIAYKNGWSAEEMQKRIDARIKILEELGSRQKVSTKEMEEAILDLTVSEAK